MQNADRERSISRLQRKRSKVHTHVRTFRIVSYNELVLDLWTMGDSPSAQIELLASRRWVCFDREENNLSIAKPVINPRVGRGRGKGADRVRAGSGTWEGGGGGERPSLAPRYTWLAFHYYRTMKTLGTHCPLWFPTCRNNRCNDVCAHERHGYQIRDRERE